MVYIIFSLSFLDSSETSLEGWKPFLNDGGDVRIFPSETSLEGWKRTTTPRHKIRPPPSETSLEGWKQNPKAFMLEWFRRFRNFLRGMETGRQGASGPPSFVLPKLP